MKEQYVRDLVEGARVDSVFALTSRDIRSARTGDAYLALEASDATGSITAVKFRPSGSDQAVPAGTVVRLRGTVTSFRGTRRISIESMRPETSYDRSDLLAAGVRQTGEMLDELRALVRSIEEPGLRAVVNAVFGAAGFMDRFASCPAAVGRHHAYVGGLLEHTVSVAGLCRSLAASYPTADADLLVAAALLHDVGKVDELAYDAAIEFTDSGRLVGHTVLGDRIVTRAVAKLGRRVPDATALRLSHAILAHHGELEWGAPRRPCTIEALLLHHADNMDAQAASFGEAVSGAAVLEERWSDAANGFGRPLMVPMPRPPAPARVCA